MSSIGTSGLPRQDAALSVAAVLFSGLLWWQADKVPPPIMDPLGSAAVPKAIAALLALFALVMLVRVARAWPWPAVERPDDYRRRPDLAAGIFALTVAYVASMQAGIAGFAIATTVFLICAVVLLSAGNRRIMLAGAAFAFVLGFGGDWMFSELFFIDLPR